VIIAGSAAGSKHDWFIVVWQSCSWRQAIVVKSWYSVKVYIQDTGIFFLLKLCFSNKSPGAAQLNMLTKCFARNTHVQTYKCKQKLTGEMVKLTEAILRQVTQTIFKHMQ